MQTVSLGAQAGVNYQTSASAIDSLSSQDISVSGSAQATYGLLSGTLSGSYTSDDATSIVDSTSSLYLSTITQPAIPLAPVTASGTINFTAWGEALAAANSYAPLSYTIYPLSNLTYMPSLFTTATFSPNPNKLIEVGNAMNAYFIACENGAGQCTTTSSTCNAGSCVGGSEGQCQSCFGSSSQSPNGPTAGCPTTAIGCNTQTCQCFYNSPPPPPPPPAAAINQYGLVMTSYIIGNNPGSPTYFQDGTNGQWIQQNACGGCNPTASDQCYGKGALCSYTAPIQVPTQLCLYQVQSASVQGGGDMGGTTGVNTCTGSGCATYTMFEYTGEFHYIY